MNNSNALDDLKSKAKTNGKKRIDQWEEEDYDAIAEKMIEALKSHGSDEVRDALNRFRGFVFDYDLAFLLIKILKGELSMCADDKTKTDYVYV